MDTPVQMDFINPLRELNGGISKSTSKLPVRAFSRVPPRKRNMNDELSVVKRSKLDLSMETDLPEIKSQSSCRKRMPLRKYQAQGKLRRSVSLSELPNKNKTTTVCKPTAVATKVAIESLKQPTRKENRPPNLSQASSVPTKKRPAWDVKGRLEDLEKKHKSLLSAKSVLEQKYEEQLSKVEQSDIIRCKLSQIESQYSQLQSQFRAVNLEKDHLKYENIKLAEENCVLKEKNDKLDAENLKFEKEMRINSEKLAIIMDELENLKMENESLCENVKNLKETVSDLTEKRNREEIIRRNLHNTIMELKGNIRVFCRVRPTLDNEYSKEILTMEFAHPEGNKISLMRSSNKNECSSVSNRSHCAEFSFDKVFEPSATQQEVFEEISQLIQSSLDGYHVCIFAYGQTGSGKTYTMEGPKEIDECNSGMIRRAVDQIFENVVDLAEKSWKYTIEVSMVEIYNETVRDLLTKKSSAKRDLKTKDNEVVVNDTTVSVVKNSEEVHRLLKIAHRNRAVAATKCNDYSSRSHSVFMMKITGDNESTGQKCHGALNLIDLAGSERLKQSDSVGARLTETKHINTSLSSLGTVIMALAQKADHIPYRNSKLTYLLKNSLGGQSKMLMFVNISPLKEHEHETYNSLRFAKQVNECHIGPPQKK